MGAVGSGLGVPSLPRASVGVLPPLGRAGAAAIRRMGGRPQESVWVVSAAFPVREGETPGEWSERVLKAMGRTLPPPPAGIGPLKPRVETLSPVRRKTKVRKCAYCGEPTTGKVACHGHSDLPKLDPLFNSSYTPKKWTEQERKYRRYWAATKTQQEIDSLARDISWLDLPDGRSAA